MKAKDDLYYWQRFIQGDSNALSNIYILYVDDLYSYGMKIYPDESLIKDAIQEVFIHLIEKQKILSISKNIKTYIFRSLRNKILEELRSKNRKTKIESLIFNSKPPTIPDTEQMHISSEEECRKQMVIQKALAHLSKNQKEAIYLRFTDGCNYEEISEIMEISIPSARTLVYRAIKQMKEFIFNEIHKKIHIYFILNCF